MIDARDPRTDEAAATEPAAGRASAPDPVRDVCPYLVASTGRWRSATPSRDHVCGAVRPSASLSSDKQRQLCLSVGHAGCATYRAAMDLDAVDIEGAPPDAGSLLWPAVRSTPVVLEPAQRRLPGLPLRGPRAAGQLALAAVLVVAFVIVMISRASPPSGGTPGGSADAGGSVGAGAISPSPARTGAPSAAPSPSLTASPNVSASPSPSTPPSPSPSAAPPTATPLPSPTPAPTGSQTYTVRSGDTLSGIAARFGTTVKVLAQLNGITDPRLIRVGQVLIIP